MKLLNSFVSPFAARVRMAIHAYDLPVEIAPSGQWTPDYRKSPDYLAINPIGLVPTLVLDDGSALPESSVIVEYLADAFPGTGLIPKEAQAAARARLIAHLVEVYVQMPAGPLFGQLFAEVRDQKRIEAAVAAMDRGVSHLEHFMGDDWPVAGAAITVADCALVPYLYLFADRMTATFGAGSIIDTRPRVAAYWNRIQADPTAQRVLDEMRAAIVKSPLSKLLPATP